MYCAAHAADHIRNSKHGDGMCDVGVCMRIDDVIVGFLCLW